MKFTSPLCKGSERWLWKKLWKRRGTFQDRPAKIPKAVAVSGLPIVDLNAEETQETWMPPVPDDPQFKEHPSIREWPNYNDEPAYVYLRGQRMMEGTKQACILTKAVRHEGFPESVRPLVGSVHVKNEDKLLQRYIMQSQIWDPSKERLPKRIDTANVGYKFTREYGIPKVRSCDILMRNLIRLCQSSFDQHPSIIPDLRLIPDPYLGTHYYYQGNLVNIEGFSKFILLSNKRPKAYVDEEAVDESVNQDVPDMYPISPLININKRHDYTLQNIAGLNGDCSHSHPHTIFLSNNNYWSDDLRQASALLFSFGYAITEARKLYGDNVKYLPEPVSVQCVNMNHTTLNFTFFQLNTTNFSSNDGIKNFVWFDNSNHLFQKALPQPWRGDEFEQTYYHSYNPHAFHKLLALFLSNTPEAYKTLNSSDDEAESVTQ